MFQWDTPKVEPSEQDMLILMNKQYSLRLDLERKLVEHATTLENDQSHVVDDDDELGRLLCMDESGESVDKIMDQQSSCKKLKTQ